MTTATLLPDRATIAARVITAIAGPDAVLRADQETAVAALCEPASRVLVVQATGWGKSAVYWAATAIRRAEGAGPTLVVSPLLSLMRDQVAAAARAGLHAATLNSSNIDEWSAIEGELRAGQVDVLLVSPERLANPGFGRRVLDQLAGRIGLLVIDEAHAVSDWGHDFRPDYRRVADVLRQLNPDTPVLATTATANARVTDDVATQLGTSTLVLRGPLARESLQLAVVDRLTPIQRFAWVVDHLPRLAGSGIVYTLTVADAERLAGAIQAVHGDAVPVAAYTGGLEPAERIRLEDALRANELKALVATSALGMGYDKPDLGLRHPRRVAAVAGVVLPAGRPSRSRDRPRPGRAAAVRRRRRGLGLLRHRHDPGPGPGRPAARRTGRLRRGPTRVRARARGRDRAAPHAGRAHAQAARRGRCGRPGRRRLGPHRRALDVRRRALRRDRRGTTARGRHHARLHPRRTLPDAAAAGVAGRPDRCALRPVLGLHGLAASAAWRRRPPLDVARAVSTALRRETYVLEPRKMWPGGAFGSRGRIAPDQMADTGRALVFADAPEWRDVVRAAFDRDGPADDELTAACVDLLRRWSATWAERPEVVVALPAAGFATLVDVRR